MVRTTRKLPLWDAVLVASPRRARQSTEWKGLAFRAMALPLINMQERTLASKAVQELQAYLREGCQTSLASYKSTMNVKAAAHADDD